MTELILLAGLLFSAGCATFIFAAVWFQFLQAATGSSPIHAAFLLSAIIGGVSLGSLAATRVVSLRRHPLIVLAAVQLAIGVLGVLVLFLTPYVGRLLPIICVLPSLLIGTVLSIAARSLEPSTAGVSTVGWLFGSFLTGAAAGNLLSTFYLLRFYDGAVATYVAATITVCVATVCLLVSHFGAICSSRNGYVIDCEKPRQYRKNRILYFTLAMSGFGAAGLGIVWTRLLSLLLGPSVYTFSVILAAFLFGLGAGCAVGAVFVRPSVHPGSALGLCQAILSGGIAWGAHATTNWLPYWQVDPTLSTNMLIAFQVDLSRCIWAILPATALCGATFPLAVAAASSGVPDPGRLAGRVSGACAAGAFFGSLVFTLILISPLGTQRAQQVVIGVTALASLLMLVRTRWVAVPLACATGFALIIPPPSGDLIAYGRFLARNLAVIDPQTKEPFVPNMLYVAEGRNSSVAVSALPSGFRNLHVSGRIDGSNQPHEVRLHRMLGHLPALYHPSPGSALVLGFGTGIATGALLSHPSVNRVIICEAEPLIIDASRYFALENGDPAQDQRVTAIYDDARRYIVTSEETFDVIIARPPHPWVRGAAALYTREYFELIKAHLNPGGVVSVWLPLHETDQAAVKSEVATFFNVFPQGTIWGNQINTGVGYDLMLLAKNGASSLDLDNIYARLNRQDHGRVVQSLQNTGFGSVAELFATYTGRRPDLMPWLDNSEINEDRNMRLGYLAGMQSNIFRNQAIYNDLLTYRKFPDELFTGSDVIRQSLRDLIR